MASPTAECHGLIEGLIMRTTLALAALCLLFVAAGCEVESGYGGAYGVVGESPNTYYAPAPVHVYPYYGVPPYDRDHYWDRRHYWDRHRYWHHDHD